MRKTCQMKTKTTRIILLGLAVLLFLLPFAGCQPNTSDTPEPIEGPKFDDLVETDKLVIYIMKANESWERRPINQFSAVYGVDVEVVPVDGDAFAYAERVMNDLAGGSGPDVLFVEKLSGFDVSKVAMNHNFLDLTDILAEDPEFSEDDYVDGVFEAGRFGGRQYTIPVSYDLRLTVSSSETLGKLGFDWEKIDTMSDYLEEIARLTPDAQQDASFQQMLYSKNSLNILLWASGIRLIDYEVGKVLPDEKALRELLEAYKAYFPYDYDESVSGLALNIGDHLLMSGQYAFWLPTDIEGMAMTMSTMRQKSCDYIYRTIPGQTEGVVGCIDSQMAICANAKNTLNAYKFIKFMLSEEIQAEQYLLTGIMPITLPISQAALRKRVQEAPSVYEEHGIELLDYENPAFSDEEAEAILATLTGVDQFAQREPYDLWKMLFDAMLPFFKDERSYDDCLSELKNKLTFYLSE